jgi:hypothetical protein
MTWVKRKDTEEAREFWSKVESVARRVRNSEVHANYRVPRKQTNVDTEQHPDDQQNGTRSEPHSRSGAPAAA